jgi:hypothetical protein
VTLPDPDSGGGGGNGAIVYDNFCGRIADLNCDGNINIFDLSILLYYLKHPDVFTALQDLKPDNKIDFSDLSVLFYYWD